MPGRAAATAAHRGTPGSHPFEVRQYISVSAVGVFAIPAVGPVARKVYFFVHLKWCWAIATDYAAGSGTHFPMSGS